MRWLRLTLAVLALALSPSAASAFSTDWPYYFCATAKAEHLAEAIDYLAYDLSKAPAGFWSAVKSDGSDIRVTESDRQTELAREIVYFDQGNEQGWVFAAQPSNLAASTDTPICIFYGNAEAEEPGPSDPNGRSAVWGGFLEVWHCAESASPCVGSKTGAQLAAGGGTTFGAAGKFGNAPSFDGSDDRLDGGDIFDYTSPSMGLIAWIKAAGLGEASQGFIISKINPTEDTGYRLNLNADAGLSFRVGDGSGSNTVRSDNGVIVTDGSAFQLVAVSYNGTNAAFFVDGVAEGSPSLTRVPANTTASFYIGNISDATIRSFNGIIHSIKLKGAFTADYIATVHAMEKEPGDFWATGTQQSNTTGRNPAAWQMLLDCRATVSPMGVLL